jgi:hypothetical protein
MPRALSAAAGRGPPADVIARRRPEERGRPAGGAAGAGRHDTLTNSADPSIPIAPTLVLPPIRCCRTRPVGFWRAGNLEKIALCRLIKHERVPRTP